MHSIAELIGILYADVSRGGLRSEDLLLTSLYIWFMLMFDSPIYSSISETLASSASTLDVKSPLSSEIPSFKNPLFDEL